MDAEALRRKAAELLEQARHEQDPVKHFQLLEQAVDCIAKARRLDREKRSN